MCNCPSGQVESNGKCLTQCEVGLRGIYQDHCMVGCPSDSYKHFDWGRTGIYQDYSKYDPSNTTLCTDSDHHLLFKKTGQGILVNGPLGLRAVPSEFTIMFWIKPSGSFISYGRNSYILNLFNTVKFYVTTTNRIKFSVGDTGATIEPTYDSANDTLDFTQWNFVAATLKHTKTASNQEVHIQLAIARGRTGTLLDAGEATLTLPTFNTFSNTIMLGGDTVSTPNSFSGYLKEVRFFKKYHSFAQLEVDQLKKYQPSGIDDKNLIAQWKLDESYNSSDYTYIIHDYSLSQNSQTIYLSTNPLYPSFVDDSANTLNLCNYHDVANCLTLDKSEGKLAPFSYAAWKYSYAPTMNIGDASLTIQDLDELSFCLKRDCKSPEARLYRTFGRWLEDELNPEPTDALSEGTHYYICYFSEAYDIKFPIAQIYIAQIIDKISPSELSSFLTTGVTESWDFSDGDQAYGDTIMFAED